MTYKNFITYVIGFITLPLSIYTIYNYEFYKEQKRIAQQDLAQRITFPDGKVTYQELNQTAPFVLSIGISRSQTGNADNTCNPNFIKQILSQHFSQNESQIWLSQQAEFTPKHKQAFIEQINYLGVKDQQATTYGLPTYRYSCEMADVLENGKLSTRKIKEQAKFLQAMGNPMLFMHHYTNPASNPHMFENSEDCKSFAQYCKYIVLASDHITHVCPISQTIAFGLRMAEQKNLPPFSCNVDVHTYLEHLAQAHIESYKAIKTVNPNVQVLVSHQWKPMVPKHTWTDPTYYLELFTCWIANGKYNTNCPLPKIGNKGFVELFKDKQEYFDGIALSLYPRLIFDGTKPNDPNCSGDIDAQAALEAIIQTHEAFPTKPIYIAETGCNTNDPHKKKQFIDMTLYVCKLARNMSIDIRGAYLWGHTNDKDFYYEWGKPTGSSYFGPFDTLDPTDPTGSINETGKYIKYIVTQ